MIDGLAADGVHFYILNRLGGVWFVMALLLCCAAAGFARCGMRRCRTHAARNCGTTLNLRPGQLWNGMRAAKSPEGLTDAESRQRKAFLKNKCGPGQPPGPHWFSRKFCDPSPRTRHGGSSSRMRSEERLTRCTRQIAICEASFANQSATPRWPAASPAVCGGLCEEAATPGQPDLRRSAFPEDPSQRFTLENHRAPPALP